MAIEWREDVAIDRTRYRRERGEEKLWFAEVEKHSLRKKKQDHIEGETITPVWACTVITDAASQSAAAKITHWA